MALQLCPESQASEACGDFLQWMVMVGLDGIVQWDPQADRTGVSVWYKRQPK